MDPLTRKLHRTIAAVGANIESLAFNKAVAQLYELVNAIEKAIRDSDLGVNPTNNGDNLRVTMPELTEDRRKEYVKLAHHKAEEARVRGECRAREPPGRAQRDSRAGDVDQDHDGEQPEGHRRGGPAQVPEQGLDVLAHARRAGSSGRSRRAA